MTIRRRTSVRATGGLFIFVTILISLGAAIGQNNVLFLIFGLALGALLVSGLVSGPMMMALRVERQAPERARAGEAMTLSYTITNTSRWLPAFALGLDETLGDGARAAGAALFVPPRGQTAVLARPAPAQRGVLRLGTITLASSFPFGLITKTLLIEQASSVLVLPRTRRLRHDALLGLVARADAGLAPTGTRGRGEEFYGLREYAPGDSPRTIAWKPSARTGTLVVREHVAPLAGAVWIWLELPSVVGSGPQRDECERAISLAASLIESAGPNLDVGLRVPSAGVEIPLGLTARHRQAMLDALARLDLEHPHADRPGASQAWAPSRADARAGAVVVHAGSIDPSAGPAGARHVSGRSIEALALDGAAPSEPQAPGAQL